MVTHSTATAPANYPVNADLVRAIIGKVRAANETIIDGYSDGTEHDITFDAEGASPTPHGLELAEEDMSDLSGAELSAALDDLNDDEAAGLVALVWIGRGDFEGQDWSTALKEARERAAATTSDYLGGMPLLADYLEAGLDALNL
ncbi:MAG: DUF3775 domain-containing protein [Pseudomonadota bacterium]